MNNDLGRSNCDEERSRDRVGLIYQAMTPEQQNDLRLAFKKHDNDSNYMTGGNVRPDVWISLPTLFFPA